MNYMIVLVQLLNSFAILALVFKTEINKWKNWWVFQVFSLIGFKKKKRKIIKEKGKISRLGSTLINWIKKKMSSSYIFPNKIIGKKILKNDGKDEPVDFKALKDSLIVILWADQ